MIAKKEGVLKHLPGYPLETRGGAGKRKDFLYVCDSESKRLTIENVDGRSNVFSFDVLKCILSSLHKHFGIDWFPLANNVEKMGKGIEKPGLGMTILRNKPGDITHAQASSYLGVIFEDLRLFEWNGVRKGICWRIVKPEEDWKLENRLIASTEA